MSTETIEVLVEGVNTEIKAPFNKFHSCGLKTENGWLNVAKAVPASLFTKGETYKLDIETNAKGYKTVVGIAGEKAVAPKKVNSAIPSIPKTAVEDTPAPGGEAPVAKAGDDKGLKVSDLRISSSSSRDKSIETQAVLKSVLESPAYAQLVVGKRESESFEIGSRMFKHFLDAFYLAKEA